MWRYEVRPVGGSFDELSIDAQLAPGPDDLGVAVEAAPYVRDVEYAAPGGLRPAPAGGGGWTVPCRIAGCHVRYRVLLRRAAEAIDDADTAIAAGDVLIAPPSTWLLRPSTSPGAISPSARFRFDVAPPPGARFAAGTSPASDGAPGAFEAAAVDLEDSSFAVFGPFHDERVRVGPALLEVAVAPSGLTLGDADVAGWVRASADAVAAYLGRFPSPRTLVIVTGGSGRHTRGETLGDGGPAVLVQAGDHLGPSPARQDWVLTHELLHVSMPSLSRRHAWLDEGMATYVEPIVRARARLIAPEKVWGDLVAGLPQGLPEPGDEGLERTHTWGRTYWGGALFFLMADVTLRERTEGRATLDAALRGIVRTGADVTTHWTVERWLDEADRATGAGVFHELYRDMALAPGTVDLRALWAKLGVQVDGGHVRFDDSAPLAAVRRAICG